jgi:two-component system cell cycle response regulator DivK
MREGREKTVLLVEDDAGLRAVIAELLETEGYAVLQVADGTDAMRMAQLHAPDVILLDVGMPKRSGLEVLHALKEAAPTRDIPVLVVSGYALVLLDGDVRRADGVIHKPFDVEVLLEQVGRLTSGPAKSGY